MYRQGQLDLDLLGTFRLRQDDQPVAGFEHARIQYLLAYLALHSAAPISQQQLAFFFWPDSTDQQALKNLRTLLTPAPPCAAGRSVVEAEASIGPFAHLRPGSRVGARAKVGNFVELKKTHLGEGSKAQHLSYLGDATVGPDVNIGAGTITCNYDGVRKSPTRIEAGAFVGSDSTLVAPVTVGEGAYVAGGSTITEDVPKDALALGRARQVTKAGWAARCREGGGGERG